MLGLELDVEHRPDDLDDSADIVLGRGFGADSFGLDSNCNSILTRPIIVNLSVILSEAKEPKLNFPDPAWLRLGPPPTICLGYK
jgi:hypothetical protein